MKYSSAKKAKFVALKRHLKNLIPLPSLFPNEYVDKAAFMDHQTKIKKDPPPPPPPLKLGKVSRESREECLVGWLDVEWLEMNGILSFLCIFDSKRWRDSLRYHHTTLHCPTIKKRKFWNLKRRGFARVYISHPLLKSHPIFRRLH